MFHLTFTCKVSNGLQFEGLQDCFEGGHLEVQLLADLHIVMFQVNFLLMSCNRNDQQKQVSEVLNWTSADSGIFKNKFTIWWNSVVASISFFSCSVNWEKYKKWAAHLTTTKLAFLLRILPKSILTFYLSTVVLKRCLYIHTHTHTMSEILLFSRLMSSLVSARTFWLSS